MVRVKPQRDGDQKTPKTPLRGSRSSSRTRATPSTVTAPTEAFASQGTDKVATCDGEALGAEAAPVKPTDVILEPAEIAERENMNETGTSAEVQPVAGQAGQFEAPGDSAIPPCSADPAHAASDVIRIDEVSGPSGLALDQQSIEAVAVPVPSIAASLLQEVAEVGKRPISAETVEQAVAGPEEKIGDENFDESATPIEAQHEATAEVAGCSRLPEMATELAQILRIEELARLQGIVGEPQAPQEQEEPGVIQSSCNPSSSQQDVGHAGGHSDSEVPEPPRAPPEEDDGTSPLKLSRKATPPVGRPLGFRRGMEKVSVKAPPRVAKPSLGKAKGAPAQPAPLAQHQTPPPPLPPPPPKGAVPKAQPKQVQFQVAEKAALPETSAATVSAATAPAAPAAPAAAKAQPKQAALPETSAATLSAATAPAAPAAPAPAAAKAQPKQAALPETSAATLSAATAPAAPAAPAPAAAKAQPKQVQFQVAEKAALPETSAAGVSAATVSAATAAPAPAAAKAQPKQVQFQVAEKAALPETSAAGVSAATVSAATAPTPVAAKAQPKQVQIQVEEKAALPETSAVSAATAPAAPAPAAPAPAAAKAQPRQVQFQVAEEATPHPSTAACAQALPAAPTAPASTVAPLVDSITRSSPSPAKAQAVHSIGAKAAARVTLKGSDGQLEGRPG